MQLQIAQIMRPIVSWRMNKGEDMLSELRFKNGGLVQVTKHYDNIELEETVRPKDHLLFFVIWHAELKIYASDAGLLLVPY